MVMTRVPSNNGHAHLPSEPPISSAGHDSHRIAVVVNGRAKNVTAEVISTLDRILKGGDLFVSRSLDDAREIAKTLVMGSYGTVLTGGGDGTFTVMVTEVVREARRAGRALPRFGLLKLGTGNSLAWVVGARDVHGGELGADIEKLSRHAGSRSLRLVEVDGIISPFCGLGADARVLADYGWLKEKLAGTPLKRVATGRLGYGLAAATRSLPRELFGRNSRCRIVNGGEEAYQLGEKGAVVRSVPKGGVLYDGPMRFAAISTIPYYGYGFRMFPYAEERPDRMHLRLTTMSPIEFLLHMRDIWRGSYEGSKSIHDFLVESVEIEMEPEVAFQIGGDSRGLRRRVEARLCPEPIELVDMYAPPSIAP